MEYNYNFFYPSTGVFINKRKLMSKNTTRETNQEKINLK